MSQNLTHKNQSLAWWSSSRWCALAARSLYQHGYNLSWEASENPQGLSNKTEGPMPYSFFFQEPAENNTVIDDATNIAGLLGFELGGQFTLPGRVATNLAAYPPCNESFNPNQMQEGQSYLEYYDCLCRYYPEEAQARGINCDMYTEVYWYHPDYLGNTEFVTDAGGYPYQFFYYSAFGESLVNQNSNTGNFATPYKFNAKEQDQETGNYYYGARYYNPQVSVWLSVDPLSHLSPNQTPYHFVSNNPIMRIDPDGLTDYLLNEDGTLTVQSENQYYKETDADGNVTYVEVEAGGDAYDGCGVEVDRVTSGKTGKQIHVQADVLKNQKTKKDVPYYDNHALKDKHRKRDVNYFLFSHEQSARDFFELAATSTNFEWEINGLISTDEYASTFLYGVSTGKHSGHSFGAAVFDFFGFKILYSDHNHPGDTGPSDTDRDFDFSRLGPKNQYFPMRVYHHGHYSPRFK